MPTCPTCSTDVADGMTFCTTCGQPMDRQPAGTVPVAGAVPAPEMPADLIFGEAATTAPHERRQRRMPWRLVQWTAGVTVLALVAFLAGWAVASERNAALLERTPTSSPAVEVAEPVSTMPDLRGLQRRDAVQVLSDLGLDVRQVTFTEQPFAGAGGLVLAQEPVYGQPVDTAITLEISAQAVVPEYDGLEAADYVALLQEFGASVTTETRFVPAIASGSVVAVSPPPGQAVPDEVTVIVSAAGDILDLAEASSETYECGSDDQTLNGRGFAADLLVCDVYGDEPTDEVYLLRRKFARLSGVLGVPDDAEQGVEVQLEVLVDGQVATRVTARYGATTPFDVSLAGALRLTLRFTPVGGGSDTYGTAAIGGGVLEGSTQGIKQMQGL